MSYLLIVRHGRTAWNRVERFRGREDLDLDRVGVRQARATAQGLARWPATAIYTSPLKRTLKTAHIMAGTLGLDPIPLPLLVDIDYGDWQGLTPEEAARRDGDLYRLWLEAPHRVRFAGGEGLAEVRARARKAVHLVLSRHPGETVALVSHNVVCRVLILVLLGWRTSHFWQVAQDVAAINVFDLSRGRPAALLLNDTCHLKGI